MNHLGWETVTDDMHGVCVCEVKGCSKPGVVLVKLHRRDANPAGIICCLECLLTVAGLGSIQGLYRFRGEGYTPIPRL